MLKIVVVLALIGAPTFSFAAGDHQPGWEPLADCAAAYRANSQIPDPNRAPSMKASVADEADEYAAAAVRRLRQQTKVSEGKAGRSVHAYVAKRVPEFARQPRSDVEHFIEACPQVGG